MCGGEHTPNPRLRGKRFPPQPAIGGCGKNGGHPQQQRRPAATDDQPVRRGRRGDGCRGNRGGTGSGSEKRSAPTNTTTLSDRSGSRIVPRPGAIENGKRRADHPASTPSKVVDRRRKDATRGRVPAARLFRHRVDLVPARSQLACGGSGLVCCWAGFCMEALPAAGPEVSESPFIDARICSSRLCPAICVLAC